MAKHCSHAPAAAPGRSRRLPRTGPGMPPPAMTGQPVGSRLISRGHGRFGGSARLQPGPALSRRVGRRVLATAQRERDGDSDELEGLALFAGGLGEGPPGLSSSTALAASSRWASRVPKAADAVLAEPDRDDAGQEATVQARRVLQ